MQSTSAETAAITRPETQSEEITGAEIVVRCLVEEGVEHVFGYPGGAVLYIYDEIFKQDKFQHILVRHEQAAVHAADAYSRSSQKTGVALVTSGPGVTNAVTGIATAYMDSVPVVIITGQVPTHAIGQDAFQECDTVGITRPCVKHNFLVKDVRQLASTIAKAFCIASCFGYSNRQRAIVTSFGMSTSTGPGRPLRAMKNALAIVEASCRTSLTRKLCLTQGRVMPTVSHS